MAKEKRPSQGAEGAARLKADLKNGEFQNFYIFCGEEAYLRSHYLGLLSDKLIGGPAGVFNAHRFTAEDLTPQALAEAVDAMPMMAERTLVRVDDVDFFKLNEGLRSQYLSIFSDLPDYCCLVLVYDTVEFKINGTIKKLAAVFKEKACVCDFQKQSERELSVWICRHFKALGKDISDELCRYLIFITDGMMLTLTTEIAKVANYCTTPAISKSDIDSVVTPALNAQSFDISNAIADGDYDRALRKLQDLFVLQEEPVVILGAIASQLRRVYYAKVLSGAGKGAQALMELTGLRSSYAANLAMDAARRVSDRFCEQAMELCLKTDRGLKTSADEPQRLLELLLLALSQEARHAS